jgi:hypothetical protein
MRTAIVLFVALMGSRSIYAQATCRLEGVWQLVSGSGDGTPYPATYRAIKLITKNHFAFVGEEERGVQDMKTAADSLRAFRTMASGGGTYTIRGNTYTEKLEYFSDPAYVGASVSFTCRTEGDRFYQTGSFPILENGRKLRDAKIDEVWRRIE